VTNLIDHPRISVDAAIRRGWFVVTLPSLLAIVIPLGLFIFAASRQLIDAQGYSGLAFFIAAFAVSIGGGWLVWSVQAPRWRLWAYQRVQDLEALKARAVQAQLTWADGSVFSKTEIKSSEHARLEREYEARARASRDEPSMSDAIPPPEDPVVTVADIEFFERQMYWRWWPTVARRAALTFALALLIALALAGLDYWRSPQADVGLAITHGARASIPLAVLLLGQFLWSATSYVRIDRRILQGLRDAKRRVLAGETVRVSQVRL
jgi:hypothetical protein